MARLYNLVRVFTTTTGTGTMTLGGAVAGFLTFAQGGVPDGAVVSYGIRDGNNSEVGYGTYAAAASTLTRSTVYASTNLGAFINLSGSAEVYITAAAQDIVEKTGDTMTGNLAIQAVQPQFSLVKNGATSSNAMFGYAITGGSTKARWVMELGNSGAESGGNAGSNLSFNSYTDAGAYLSTPFLIDRASGQSSFSAQINGTSIALTAAVSAIGGYYIAGQTSSITSDATQSTWTVTASGSYLNYVKSNGSLYFVVGGIEQWRTQYPNGDFVIRGKGYQPGGGVWADSNSDIRTKTIQGEYKAGLAEVGKLRPVSYTFKGNNTKQAPPQAKDGEPPVVVPYPSSDHYQAAESEKEYIGLIAQEVEQIFPEMVDSAPGYIDGQPVADLRSLDTSSLIYALVNAVKELKARVEALEAA
jgi:Chaperone of endosialidase